MLTSQSQTRRRKQFSSNRVRFNQFTNRPMGNPQSFISPNEFDVNLKFIDSLSLSSAGAFANYNLNPNCPYDVDPAFGSTATGGFAELAALYQFQRTVAYSYDITLCNGTGGFLQGTIINTNVTPPAIAYYGLAGNQFAQTKTINQPTSANATVRFRASHTVSQIVGSQTPETADSFASLTNNVPTDKIWLGIGITDLAGAAVTLVYAQVQLTMSIRFYERKNLTS